MNRSNVLKTLSVGILLGAFYIAHQGGGLLDETSTESSQAVNPTSNSSLGQGSSQQPPTKSSHRSQVIKSKISLEQTADMLRRAATSAREHKSDGTEFDKSAAKIPAEMWPRLTVEFEKENPSPTLRFSLQAWSRADPDALHGFQAQGGFSRSYSSWLASKFLVQAYAPQQPEKAFQIYRAWDSSIPVDQTDRNSWTKAMIQDLFSQIYRSRTESSNEWLSRLTEKELAWARAVDPERLPSE